MDKGRLKLAPPIWVLLLLTLSQQYTNVEAQTDIYHGLDDMGKRFEIGCSQFAVMTIKKQGENFDATTLPKRNDIKDWCVKKVDTYGVYKVGEYRKRYMAAIPGKGHSEFKMLEKRRKAIDSWINEFADPGKNEVQVDLMLFTYNAPCCMSTGNNGKGVLEERIKKMRQSGNKWLGCDTGSCSKKIDRFIEEMGRHYPNIRMFVSWYRPYVPRGGGKIVPPLNHPISYTLYFETLRLLSKNPRIHLWFNLRDGKTSFQRKMAAQVCVRMRIRPDDNIRMKQVFVMVNYITQFCIRNGLNRLQTWEQQKNKNQYYTFTDKNCLKKAFKNGYPLATRVQHSIFEGCLGFINQQSLNTNLERGDMMLSPPLNPDQGMNAPPENIYIFSSRSLANWGNQQDFPL
eukprot:TCONS_00009099-protein